MYMCIYQTIENLIFFSFLFLSEVPHYNQYRQFIINKVVQYSSFALVLPLPMFY